MITERSLPLDFADFFEPPYLVSLFHQHILNRNTSGRDGVTPAQFASWVNRESVVIQRKVLDGSYRFTPYRELLRVKSAGVPPRLLSAPTVRDQLVLRALKEFLHSVLPSRVDRKPANKLVRQISDIVYTPSRPRRFYRADITGFYDNIQHKILVEMLKQSIQSEAALHLIYSAIRTPTLPVPSEKVRSKRNERGVPQGLAISNILAGAYLTEFDQLVRKTVPVYVRYVDDLLLLHDGEDDQTVENFLDQEMEKVRLDRNVEKSYGGMTESGFEFLGYKFDSDKLSIRPQSVQRFINSVAGQLTRFRRGLASHLGRHPWIGKTTAVNAFVEDLNERITGAINQNRRYGWIFYFSEMTDVALLKHMDRIIADLIDRSSDLRASKTKIKRLTRAYYANKHARWSYFQDYNAILTSVDKARYLSDRGLLIRGQIYKDEVIEAVFARVRSKHLARLEKDIGDTS
jgi:retron-type reverse transcriptase